MASLISALNSAGDGVPRVPLDPEVDTIILAEIGADDRILVEDEVSVTVAIARTTHE